VLIFQKPLLFPFLNVRDNIAFGLRMQKFKTTEVESRVARMTELTELRGLASRKIHELSGGQQQRVALARGLILAPSVLLLDEPFSNLDATLRQQMRELLKRLQQETGTTMLFVTHDQGEAFSISDRIGLVLDGSIRQLGQPDALFYRPMDIKVARFFGIQNILRGNIVDGIFHSDLIECHTNLDNGPAVAIIRPEDIHHSQQPIENGIPGIITAKQFEGTVTKLTILVGQQTIQLTVLRNEYTIGQELWLHFPEDRVQINYDISF
jgi:ABC-type Fe3+/spermidine/putrescine transport system ATPase subunit